MNNHFWIPFAQEKFITTFPTAKKALNQYIWDENDIKYFDAVSSWWVINHGHCNSHISNAVIKQIQNLDHCMASEFYNDQAIELTKKLNVITNQEFYKFFFSDNGSTATEVAIKMAWQYWKNQGIKRSKFITFSGCYHGDTLGAMTCGSQSGFFNPFQDLMPLDKAIISPFPKTWMNDPDQEKKDTNAINVFKQIIQENKNDIAFLIIEPIIQGAAGMNLCSFNFMNAICRLAKENDIIIIFDEVMTGFGKTGKMFAYQHLEYTPDIICVSKSITGGFFPLGVTFAKEFIYKPFYSDNIENTFLHGHSYTANPIICSAANANLELFSEDTFIKIESINAIYRKYISHIPNIEKIRIIGTICAFNIKNTDDKYGNEFFRHFANKIKQQGIILRPLGGTIYIIPPFCSTEEDIKNTFECINQTLEQFKI